MQDEELLQLAGQLEEVLVNTGYQPLVDQHRNAVEDGRFVEVRSEDIQRDGRRVRPDQPKAGDVRRLDLTPAEQLSNLLDLIEVAVGGSLATEERTLQMAQEFVESGHSVVTVTFAPDVTQEVAPNISNQRPNAIADDLGGWTLSPENMRRRGAVNAVMETIQSLREVAGLERAQWLEPQVEQRAPDDRAPGGW